MKYCKDCKWLKRLYKELGGKPYYHCILEREWNVEETPLEKIKTPVPQKYSELNKDNKCDFYKRKWHKFWIKDTNTK